ncbi:transmembrane protein 267 [Thrips palmi]|uniref:Transmembrane protein 267 n=1 Tax=Thrips palmi TaxID=161013 RepID=A0A6P9A5Z2_THRPL|nr:transmembrane protein 267 [Thrips palmi]
MDTYIILRCLLLGLTAILGDKLVQVNQHDDMKRALCDNMTHAVIGFLTWISVHCNLGKGAFSSGRVLAQCILCALISSAIDVDHFISARSFHLKDATKLSRRPFLHCSTLPLVLFISLLVLAHYLRNTNIEIFGWVLLAAFMSHHVRDAARRGFWLWPFGSTVPLGTGLYLIITVLFPFLLSFGIIHTNSRLLRSQYHSESVLII